MHNQVRFRTPVLPVHICNVDGSSDCVWPREGNTIEIDMEMMFPTCVSHALQRPRGDSSVGCVAPPRCPFTKDVILSVGRRELSCDGHDAPIDRSIRQSASSVIVGAD